MNAKSAASEKEIQLTKENRELKSLLLSSISELSEHEKLGRVFHDFNNILSSLMGYSSLSGERARPFEDDKLMRYLSNIEKAGVRARDLVKEKLEQRQQNRTKHICAVSAVVREMMPEVDVEIAQDSVYMEDKVFAFLVGCLFNSCESNLAGARAQGTLVDFGSCRACAADLPGQQLELSFDADGIGNIDAQDLMFAQAIVSVNGGHLCQSLVQDGQIVIYLRSATK